MQSAGTTTHFSTRYGAPEALTGVLPDFDGRLSDWSAVAFQEETEACADMPIDQRLFGLAIMVLASIPYVFVGAAARWLLG